MQDQPSGLSPDDAPAGAEGSNRQTSESAVQGSSWGSGRAFLFWLVLGACVVAPALLVSATSSTAWDTTIKDGSYTGPGIYIPPCTNGSVKHWEIPTTYLDKTINIQVFDAMKAAGYTNLRFFFAERDIWIWSGDCTLGA